MAAVPAEGHNLRASAEERERPVYPGSEGRPKEDILESEACTKHPQKIRIEQHTFMGSLWCAAWLFSIGYLHLHFWRGALAIILWPYYIGAHFSGLMR